VARCSESNTEKELDVPITNITRPTEDSPSFSHSPLPSTTALPSRHRTPSTGAYAGIGVSTGLVGSLVLGIAIFFLCRRYWQRERKGTEIEADCHVVHEIYTEGEEAREVEGTHGLSELCVIREPQELDGTETSPAEGFSHGKEL
jgi:hypothetical protein